MKRLLLLSGALILLVVIVWMTGMFGGPASTTDLPDLAIDAAAISSVDVKSGNEAVRARRQDSGDWELESPVVARADTATVMRLVRQAGDIEIESIISSNPERFSRFQVDSSGGELTLGWGDRQLSLFVGKMGPDFQSRYVRLDGDDRIMLAKGVPTLSAKIDQWRDKALWQLPDGALVSASITNEGGTYGLSRTDSGWSLVSESGEIDADSAEVAEFVAKMASVQVDGFFPALTIDSVMTRVTHQLRIEFADGTTESLLMSKRKNDVAAVREGSNDVFKLFSYRLTSLTPDLEKLSK